MLSEAYSHLDLRNRTAASRQLILSTATVAAANKALILQIQADADAATGLEFGCDTAMAAAAEEEPVLVSTCTDVPLPGGLGNR